MGDLVRLILETIQFVWPLRRVQQWERALYIICGRWIWEVGPGVYPILWFFCEVHPVSIAEAIAGTERCDVTLSNGSTLSFQATCTAKVVDVRKAVCNVDNFAQTTQELLASVLADKLADVDVDRLSPNKRGRLFSDLKRWVAEEAATYGVEVSRVRFISFVMTTRTYRLLVDQSPAAVW